MSNFAFNYYYINESSVYKLNENISIQKINYHRTEISEFIYQTKYNNCNQTGKILEYVEKNLEKVPEGFFSSTTIIPFPSKNIEKYNHVFETAKHIGKLKKLNYLDLFIKITDESAKKRRKPWEKNDFGIKNIELPNSDILLFDDMYASGNTTNALIKLLKMNRFQKKIYLLILALVTHGGMQK